MRDKNLVKSKTFWFVVLGILGVVGQVGLGNIEYTAAITQIFTLLGIIGIRIGICNK